MLYIRPPELTHSITKILYCLINISPFPHLPDSCKVVKVLVAQSFLTFCNPMEFSPPGSSVHGILQAIILEWVAILCYCASDSF